MISLGVMAIRILCAFLVLEIIAESSAGDVVGKLTVGYQGCLQPQVIIHLVKPGFTGPMDTKYLRLGTG